MQGTNHKNKQLACKLFAVPGNGAALLGMSDIELLDILSITVKNDINIKKLWYNLNMDAQKYIKVCTFQPNVY